MGSPGAVPVMREGSSTGNASTCGAYLERPPRVPCPALERSPSPETELTSLSGAPRHSGASPGNCGLTGKQRNKRCPQNQPGAPPRGPGNQAWMGAPPLLICSQTLSTCRPLLSLDRDPLHLQTPPFTRHGPSRPRRPLPLPWVHSPAVSTPSTPNTLNRAAGLMAPATP